MVTSMLADHEADGGLHKVMNIGINVISYAIENEVPG
jgi:hypothetical protein